MSEARQALAEQLAEAVYQALADDLVNQSRALLVVSGGSTPVPFFKALAQKPLEWARVDITLADERWVDEQSSDSNAKLVRENLLQGPAAAANFVPLTSDAGTPEEGVPAVAEATAGLAWPASVVILGMGGDGHTASLFPDSQELGLALSTDEPLVARAHPQPAAAAYYLLGGPLHQAKRHILHITGDDKRAVLANAMGGDDVRTLPIRAFLSCPLAIYWAP